MRSRISRKLSTSVGQSLKNERTEYEIEWEWLYPKQHISGVTDTHMDPHRRGNVRLSSAATRKASTSLQADLLANLFPSFQDNTPSVDSSTVCGYVMKSSTILAPSNITLEIRAQSPYKYEIVESALRYIFILCAL